MKEAIRFGREWTINTREDYDKAMTALDDAEFIAEMSDCYSITLNEKAEIERQRVDVMRQAKERGLL